MPNWCSNYVTFLGENVGKVDKMFDKLMTQQAIDGLGIRPDWKACLRHEARFMFDIQYLGDGVYQFDSKWSPCLSLMLLIGRRFKVALEISWEEMGMSLYGSATFDPSTPDVMMIRDASCTNYKYDEMSEMYIYKAEEYESLYDLMEDAIDDTIPVPISKDQIFREG
jgi:hypothetical protein